MNNTFFNVSKAAEDRERQQHREVPGNLLRHQGAWLWFPYGFLFISLGQADKIPAISGHHVPARAERAALLVLWRFVCLGFYVQAVRYVRELESRAGRDVETVDDSIPRVLWPQRRVCVNQVATDLPGPAPAALRTRMPPRATCPAATQSTVCSGC